MVRIILLYFTLFLLLFGVSVYAQPIKKYGNSWEETCDGNICSKALYSYQKFVYEDNQWKEYTEAKSLKNIWKPIYLKNDTSNYDLSFTDFNYTYLSGTLWVKTKTIIPFTVCLNETVCKSFNIPFLANQYNFWLDFNQSKANVNGVDFNIPEMIDFNPLLVYNWTLGSASTTVKLQTVDSENLGDVYVDSDNPTINYATITALSIRNISLPQRTTRTYIMFNTSSVPSLVFIIDAKLVLDVSNSNSGTGVKIGIYSIYNNVSWNETKFNDSDLTWNNQPCGSNFDNSTNCNLTGRNYTFGTPEFSGEIFNITNFINDSYSNDEENISLVIRFTNGQPTNSYFWRSKEYTTPSARPYLNITYVIILTPQYSSDSTNSTLRGTGINHNLNWEAGNGLSGYIFSWNSSGTWGNSSFVKFSGVASTSSNISTTNSTKGIVVAWCFYANDTGNNWNGSSCVSPFTYTTTDDFPKFSNNITSNPPTYNSTNNTWMNVTWTDDLGISKVFIESNYSGTVQNYTPTQSGSIYYLNISLAVGSYYWKSYANDTYNQWNATNNHTFTINKTTPAITLYLNGSASDTSYSKTIANITATINTYYNVLLKLDINATGYGNNFQNTTAKRIENITNTTNLAIAIYNITAHFDGDENYTAVSKTLYIEVVEGNPPIYSNIIISPDSPVAYSKDATYQFNITWTDDVAVDKVIFEFNGTNSTVTTNSSSVYYTNKTDLPTGAYNYRWYANDTNNNWGKTIAYTYNLTNASNIVHINLTHGGNTYNDTDISISSDTSVGAECRSDSGLCQLFYDSNSVNSPHTTTHGGGTHTYKANSTGNANYTENSTGISQIVTSTAVTITLGGGSQPSLLNVDFNPAEINITAPPGSEKIFNITINNYEKTEVIVKIKLKGNSPSSAEIINNKSYWVVSPFESTVIQVRAVFPNVLVDRDFIIEATASMGTVIRTNDILVYLTTIEALDIGKSCQQNSDCISSNCENLVCGEPKEKPSYSTYYIIGGIALVGIGIYILKKQKKK